MFNRAYCEEGWAPKNWCFWTVVLEKILESPLDCKRRSNQSILKEISPGISLEGMMLKLKFQYFGHLMGRVDSLEKTWCWEGLGAGGEGDDRGWDSWMASLTRWTWVWVNSGSWWWTGRPGVLQLHVVAKSRTLLSDWTELNWTEHLNVFCVWHKNIYYLIHCILFSVTLVQCETKGPFTKLQFKGVHSTLPWN